MKAIDPAGFEAKFRENIDPWHYNTSRFEAFKRGVLLRACGARTFGRALELACATGETSRALAPRCLRLLSIDASETALAHARSVSRDVHRLTFALAELPRQMPGGTFDLIVVSEIAYYLSPLDLRRLIHRIKRQLAPGGSVVILHHLIAFSDAAQLPALAQRRAVQWLKSEFRLTTRHKAFRYEVAVLRRRRSAGAIQSL